MNREIVAVRIAASLLVAGAMTIGQPAAAQERMPPGVDAHQGATSDSLPVVTGKSDEARGRLGAIAKVMPETPTLALMKGMSGIVIARFDVSTTCEISNVRVMYSHLPFADRLESSQAAQLESEYRASVIAALTKWRFKSACAVARAITIEQQIIFRMEDEPDVNYVQKQEWSPQELINITLIPKGDLSPIDTAKGSCPMVLGVTALQPSAANRIRVISPPVVRGQEAVFKWLSELELIRSRKLSFFGSEFIVNIPCGQIQIK